MKFLEVLRQISDEWKNLRPTNDWIDDVMIPTLSDLERFWSGVDREKFFDRWPDNQKSLWFSRAFHGVQPIYNNK